MPARGRSGKCGVAFQLGQRFAKQRAAEGMLVVARSDVVAARGGVGPEPGQDEPPQGDDDSFQYAASMRFRNFAVSCLMSEVTRCLAR